MLLDFTFLTVEQIFGNNQLDILKKYGTNCAITDFSLLLGGYKGNNNGSWWTKSCDGDNRAGCVGVVNNMNWNNILIRSGGVRPALPYSSISSIALNGVRGKNGILEVEYGEYPQTVVSKDFAITLESAYENETLNKTGKSYTTDSAGYYNTDPIFRAKTHTEYEYNGRKYIRFVSNENRTNCSVFLSDGREIESWKVYWLEVEPIKWLVDEKADIALSKHILFAGVQFNNKKEYTGDFNNSFIKKFMNEHFSKDIVPSKVVFNNRFAHNVYNFDFSEVSVKEESMETLKSLAHHNIHPALYMYLAYCIHNGEDVFNLESGEIADLDRFVLSSQILYKTKKPGLLRATMGKKLAEKFIEFAKSPVISSDDVLSGNYTEAGLKTIFNTIGSLTNVSEEEIGLVRTFVKKFDEEICELYDVLWSKGDNERIRIIDELKQEERELSPLKTI